MEEPSPQTQTSPKRRAKFLIGGTAIVFTVVGLVVWGLNRPGSTAFYMTTSEVVAAAATAGEYRVNGTVVPGTIETDGLVTTFQITDGGTAIEVTTDQPLPDAFQPRSEVIALGTYEGGRLVAGEVLAKCPSKFKAKA